METPYKPDLIIYHDKCADGIVAAWACWKKWGGTPTYLAANYGFRPPAELRGLHILIVDFSYSTDDLGTMIDRGAASIIILDHHKTAQEALAPFAVEEEEPGSITQANVAEVFAKLAADGERPIVAIFDMERSGARMAWSFAHRRLGQPYVPWLVELAEQYDLWRFQPGTADDAELLHLEIQRGGLTIQAMDALHAELTYSRAPLDRGEIIYQWRELLIDEIADRAYPIDFAGFSKVMRVDCPYGLVSSVGHRLLKDAPDAPFVACAVSGAHSTTFSLRSEDSRADVSAVASSLGGGGHRNAAGVRLDRATNCSDGHHLRVRDGTLL